MAGLHVSDSGAVLPVTAAAIFFDGLGLSVHVAGIEVGNLSFLVLVHERGQVSYCTAVPRLTTRYNEHNVSSSFARSLPVSPRIINPFLSPSHTLPAPPRPYATPLSALAMDVDQFAATKKALRIPELLTSILRCLGPLEWIKCASVCSDWHDIILGGGDQAKQQSPAVPEAATPVASASPVALLSTEAAASTAAAEGETTTRSWEGKGKAEVVVAASTAADLWREFAVTAMHYRDPCANAYIDDNNSEDNKNTNSSSACCSGRTHRHAIGISGRRGRVSPCSHSTSAPGHFYRNVCLEGDPTVLGPPLIATVARIGSKTAGRGGVKIATVSLKDVAAASATRCRHPRYCSICSYVCRSYGDYPPSSPGTRHGSDSSECRHSTG